MGEFLIMLRNVLVFVALALPGFILVNRINIIRTKIFSEEFKCLLR